MVIFSFVWYDNFVDAAHNIFRKERMTMKKMEELMASLKLDDLLEKRDCEKKKKTVMGILAVIGVIAAVAGIAYAVYRFVRPECACEDDDFEDDFDDDFFEDVDFFEEEKEEKEEGAEDEAKAEEPEEQ